jgi:L-fuconolactonase
VRAAPDTQFVLDHLGKPPIAARELQPWAAQIAQIAALPNVSAKLSGLATEAGGEWTVDDLVPYVSTAVDLFGGDRLMLGSDWPVVRRAGGLSRWFDSAETLLRDLGEPERAAIRGLTAERVYGLARDRA